MKHVNINHLFNKVVKLNVDKHIWLNKLMRYNHSFNDPLLILKICISLMHGFWMTTSMHYKINPIFYEAAWLQDIFSFLKTWNLLFSGFKKRVKFGSHFTTESLTTMRWGAFGDFEMTIWKRKKTFIKENVIHGCVAIWQKILLYIWHLN